MDLVAFNWKDFDTWGLEGLADELANESAKLAKEGKAMAPVVAHTGCTTTINKKNTKIPEVMSPKEARVAAAKERMKDKEVRQAAARERMKEKAKAWQQAVKDLNATKT
jgi:hypothetical protein